MGIKKKAGSSKNPPILSHEFIIQNHADIVSCFAMVFVFGLMIQATSPMASMFVVVQHNTTLNGTDGHTAYYTAGSKDFCTIFFYTLIGIVLHAVLQEYIIDRVRRKLHFSKTKLSKFNESGQLAVFCAASFFWGASIIYDKGYFSKFNLLWKDYPHRFMDFSTKFFFIVQISYWIHAFPELYFQKTKKEEMFARIQQPVIYLLVVLAGYCFNLNRLALVLLTMHYFAEALFHVARLAYFAEKNSASSLGFTSWNAVFVTVRLISIVLAVVTFSHGLGGSSADTIDYDEGNFNTFPLRMAGISIICGLQVWFMWRFIQLQLRRWRETGSSFLSAFSKKSDSDAVGADGKRELRQRKPKAKSQ